MPRFLIETSHGSDTKSCERIVRYFLNSGSHFLSNADWGCVDGVHKCWIIVDTASKEEALEIVPHQYRVDTTVTKLEKFSLEKVDEVFGPAHE